jgi:hypothetical protein
MGELEREREEKKGNLKFPYGTGLQQVLNTNSKSSCSMKCAMQCKNHTKPSLTIFHLFLFDHKTNPNQVGISGLETSHSQNVKFSGETKTC